MQANKTKKRVKALVQQPFTQLNLTVFKWKIKMQCGCRKSNYWQQDLTL